MAGLWSGGRRVRRDGASSGMFRGRVLQDCGATDGEGISGPKTRPKGLLAGGNSGPAGEAQL